MANNVITLLNNLFFLSEPRKTIPATTIGNAIKKRIAIIPRNKIPTEKGSRSRNKEKKTRVILLGLDASEACIFIPKPIKDKPNKHGRDETGSA